MFCLRISHLLGVFQSTRPVRGATGATTMQQPGNSVSIHAPRTGRDQAFTPDIGAIDSRFNPRAPYGARRPMSCCSIPIRAVSIHAPRTGRDQGKRSSRCQLKFQSTRPVRGATRPDSLHRHRASFNPRAPYGARRRVRACGRANAVSIHAPHTGRDLIRMAILHGRLAGRNWRYCFNPRAPRGARRQSERASGETMFQSTRPARGATSAACTMCK